MKKISLFTDAFLIFTLALLFSLVSCVENSLPAKMTIDTEKDRAAYGNEIKITPMNDSVTVTKNEITFAPEHEGEIYYISGYFKGQLISKTKNTVLRFDNAYIEYDRGKAAVKCSAKTEISAAPNSVNYIVSRGRSFSKNAALQGKRGITLGGSGSLYIVGGVCHGLEADDVKIKGSGNFYIQGESKGSAISCGSLEVDPDKSFNCYLINSKNGIKAEGTIKIASGNFYLYNNKTALRTEISKKTSAKARAIMLSGGIFHTFENQRLYITNDGAYNGAGATFIED